MPLAGIVRAGAMVAKKAAPYVRTAITAKKGYNTYRAIRPKKSVSPSRQARMARGNQPTRLGKLRHFSNLTKQSINRLK